MWSRPRGHPCWSFGYGWYRSGVVHFDDNDNGDNSDNDDGSVTPIRDSATQRAA